MESVLEYSNPSMIPSQANFTILSPGISTEEETLSNPYISTSESPFPLLGLL